MGWRGIKFVLVPLSATALLFAAIIISGCNGGDSSARVEASGPATTVEGGGAGPPVETQSNDDGGLSPWMGARSDGTSSQGSGVESTVFQGTAGQGSVVQSTAVQGSVVQSTAPEPQAYDFNYTVLSASAMPVGARVSLVRADISGSCLKPGRVSSFSPVASGVVTNAGSVSLRFNDTRNRPFVEIIYIDSNDSGHLDAGDRIWGSNPKDPAGICFSPGLNSANRVDWDGVAAVIGGSAIYSGDFQDFLAAAAGESQIPAGSLIIGESGYENL